MHSRSTVDAALAMSCLGVTTSHIARTLGVSRAAVRDWQRGRTPRRDRTSEAGPAPPHPLELDGAAYAYLLGLYLGDGCITANTRGHPRLRISCCDQYPGLMDLCEAAMVAVLPAVSPRRTQRAGCVEVNATSAHWCQLFPQHGVGRKHERPIVLEPWQEAIVARYPQELVRGLIHSDGCRCINRVTRRGRQYEYPRYFFKNESVDIQRIFTVALDRLGIPWRQDGRNQISIARRDGVERLDEFVGPKF